MFVRFIDNIFVQVWEDDLILFELGASIKYFSWLGVYHLHKAKQSCQSLMQYISSDWAN